MKIVIIGAGNVGTSIGKALFKVNHKIVQVCSRSISSARLLARRLHTDCTNDAAKVHTGADVYFITTGDSFIRDVAGRLKTCNGVLVHTSGSTEMNILKPFAEDFGVFYPLQTFNKEKPLDFTGIPIHVEGNNEKTEKLLVGLARSISENVHVTNSDKRLALHVSAVFACNFVNHMFAISSDIIKHHSLSFEHMKPLVYETIEKAFLLSPRSAQTGPAHRGDQEILEKHARFLKDENTRKLYRIISKSIQDYKNF